MKAISAIIVVVLLLLISISLISVVYVWSSALTGTVTSTTEETTSELTKQLSGCLKIDTISKNQIYLRNCGKGVITNNSLSVFIDDVEVGHSLEEIGEDQTGTVNISGLWKFSLSTHNLKLTNGAAFVQAIIELEPNKDGLVGYWSFDEGSGNKIYDKSGNGNDGNLLDANAGNGDGNTPPQWVSGKFGSALSFDGTDDYVDIPLSLSSQEVTGMAWIKVDAAPTEKKGILTASGYAFHMWLNPAGTINFGAWTHSTNEEHTSSKSFSFGVWRHIAVVNRGATDTKLYVDGKLIDTFPLSGNLRDISFFNIGRHPGINGNYLNGLIDNVYIWNKALTPDQTVVMKMV